jgi:four helix bundle protein
MKENLVFDKSKDFAIRIVNLYKYLCETKKEYVLSKQVLRSGTSIGANIAESECAISKKDFMSKLYIALKEATETLYWLELLYKTEYIDNQMYRSVYNDCEEIKKILQASTKTLNNNLK